MNLTLEIDVPDENREAIEKIADLDQRVSWFVNEQAALEVWRSEHHKSEDRELAARAIQRAEEMKQGELDRTAIAESFLKRWDRVMSSIAK